MVRTPALSRWPGRCSLPSAMYSGCRSVSALQMWFTNGDRIWLFVRIRYLLPVCPIHHLMIIRYGKLSVESEMTWSRLMDCGHFPLSIICMCHITVAMRISVTAAIIKARSGPGSSAPTQRRCSALEASPRTREPRHGTRSRRSSRSRVASHGRGWPLQAPVRLCQVGSRRYGNAERCRIERRCSRAPRFLRLNP
mgnify:CR=1 FL=1